MSQDTRIAVDVAKAVFEIAISDRPGHVIRRERQKRHRFLPYLAQQAPATAVMEACGSAHYWAREIQKLGHQVILLPPHHVRPYIRRNKTDRTDAKGNPGGQPERRHQTRPRKDGESTGPDLAPPAALRLDAGFPARGFVMARGPQGLQQRGRRYVCSPPGFTRARSAA